MHGDEEPTLAKEALYALKGAQLHGGQAKRRQESDKKRRWKASLENA